MKTVPWGQRGLGDVFRASREETREVGYRTPGRAPGDSSSPTYSWETFTGNIVGYDLDQLLPPLIGPQSDGEDKLVGGTLQRRLGSIVRPVRSLSNGWVQGCIGDFSWTRPDCLTHEAIGRTTSIAGVTAPVLLAAVLWSRLRKA